MMEFVIKNWAAWGSQLETQEEWKTWPEQPSFLSQKDHPKLSFIPAIQRRRFSSLSRMFMQVAYDCCPDEDERAQVCSVFASRHGEMTTTHSLLQSLARKEAFSPQKFSHSVHNTSSGHFSIVAQNKNPTVSISAGECTFSYGFLESLTFLHRYPGHSVLYIMADEPLPEAFKKFDNKTSFPYSVGLLLSSQGVGYKLKFGVDDSLAPQENSDSLLPHALLFLKWLLSSDSRFRLQQQYWEKMSASS